MTHPKTARRGFIAPAYMNKQQHKRPSKPATTKTEHLLARRRPAHDVATSKKAPTRLCAQAHSSPPWKRDPPALTALRRRNPCSMNRRDTSSQAEWRPETEAANRRRSRFNTALLLLSNKENIDVI
ncbi:hypothetical protein YC2023_037751 [Brassica napus]